MAELNIKFGQIPFWAICRFGERSKIEIVVFSFICAKRFRNTGEADCTRQEIIEYTGLDKSQVATAIKKLSSVAVGWLEPVSKTKWFVPEIEPETKAEKVDDLTTNELAVEPEKVDDSSTNEPEIKVDDFTTKVDESSTEVDDSSTEVDESSTNKNSHIRNSFSSDSSDFQTFRQTTTNARAPDEKPPPKETAAEIVERVLKFTPSNFTVEALDASQISNLILWQQILNEKKAGMTEDQSKNLTWKNKAVQFALADYGKRSEANQNGKISNGYNQGTPTAKQIESSERLNAILAADSGRFKSPTLD